MIISLLVVSFVISLVVASLIVLLFSRPVGAILQRILKDDVSKAWVRYLQFAIFVVGVGSGVEVWTFERYLTPQGPGQQILELTTDRWVLQIYSTIIGTLQGAAWLLLIFFVFSLVALVIVRGLESRRGRPDSQ